MSHNRATLANAVTDPTVGPSWPKQEQARRMPSSRASHNGCSSSNSPNIAGQQSSASSWPLAIFPPFSHFSFSGF